MKRCVLSMSILIALSALCHAQSTPLATERVAGALVRPVWASSPPGDADRLFIVEKRGQIRILNLGTGALNAVPFLNIDSIVGGGGNDFDERGLLGLAFDPDYANSGLFYVYYTNNASDTVLARYSVDPMNPDLALPGSQEILLVIDQPFTNHNGGWIGFGPDGFLYVATGDGGSGCDPAENAQNINNLLGNILRLDVSTPTGFAIPMDNPFVGVSGRDEIWLYGLRNPFRCAFDAITGDFFMGDVGQGAREEVNILPGGSVGGENYGWDCMEGSACSSASGCPLSDSPCTCFDPSLVLPEYEYSRGGNPFRCAITGGEVYRGCAIPDLRGTYFFADYCSNQIWSFRYVDGVVTDFQERTSELLSINGGFIADIVSFGSDNDGELYIVDQGGEIFRIIADGPVEDPALFDINTDRAVDIADYQLGLDGCMTGPDDQYANCLCDHFDIESNLSIDMIDLAAFQTQFGN